MILIHRSGNVLQMTGRCNAPVIRLPVRSKEVCVWVKENEQMPYSKEFKYLEFDYVGEVHGEVIYKEL